MSSLPHVFTDASVSSTTTTLAVYCPQLSISYSHTLPRTLQAHEAELLAHRLGRKLVPDAHYFTDNMHVATTVGIHWIPREYNRQADKLSKNHSGGTPVSNICHYLLKTYSYEQRLRLANRALSASFLCIHKMSLHSAYAKRLVHSIFTSTERPAKVKQQTGIRTLTDAEITTLLRKLR